MPSVYKNIAANYIGNIFTAALAFLFVPVYVHYLGVSTYGIIGFFATIQVLFSFLDMGIGMAINREMARHYHQPERADYLRNLSHTLQIVYWGIGLLIGIVLLLGSPYLSTHWFKETSTSRETIMAAFVILSLTITFRWPYGLYSSGLRGMQHQVALNIHDLCWNLVKTIGSWVVIKYFSNTLQAFLWFQFTVTILQTFGVMIMLWYFMPAAVDKKKAVFDKRVLREISHYAAGMGISAILGTIVLQMDKIIVSKMVSDTEFGYYTIATNVAMLVYNVSFPIYMAILPHFTRLFFDQNLGKVKEDFHFYARLLSCLLLPFAIIIFFYSEEFIWLWTKNAELAVSISPVLKLMIIGTTFNAMLMPVHTMLLANNRVRFMLYSHAIAFILAIPVIALLTMKFGVKGGAISVLILFSGYILVQAPLIFKNLKLYDSLLKWYFRDILFFAAPLILVSLILTRFKSYFLSNNRLQIFLALGIITLVYYCIVLLLNKRMMAMLMTRVKMIAGRPRHET